MKELSIVVSAVCIISTAPPGFSYIEFSSHNTSVVIVDKKIVS